MASGFVSANEPPNRGHRCVRLASYSMLSGPPSERTRTPAAARNGRDQPAPCPRGARPAHPAELQITQLAATGLTNREIGQMLYLSPRTISSHLYRTFPKLGITSRAELRGVLERGIPEPG